MERQRTHFHGKKTLGEIGQVAAKRGLGACFNGGRERANPGAQVFYKQALF